MLTAKAKGATLILDNGAYEGVSLSFDKYWEAIVLMSPDVVVLQDDLYDPDKSFSDSARCLNQLLQRGYRGKTMWVIQDGHQAAEYLRIACYESEWIGLPRRFKNRARFVYRYGDHCAQPRTIFHALGMQNGSIAELAQLRDFGVYSCDSSAPVWRGIHGVSFGEPWQDIPFNPLCASKSDDINTALDNLKVVWTVCK